MGASIGSPVPSIERKDLDPKKKTTREHCHLKIPSTKAPWTYNTGPGLESQTRTHQTLNAQGNLMLYILQSIKSLFFSHFINAQ